MRIENGVWWERQGEDTAAELISNIEHRVKHHSPTGMNVGYAGSGPADFALNILETRLRMLGYNGAISRNCWNNQKFFADVWDVYQLFKRDFLTDPDLILGGQILWADIDAWLTDCYSAAIREFMRREISIK